MLYVVPTPVGNLEDMTFRAVRVLKEADFILAEDTRTSSVLLQHYDIHGELLSHHKFNEHETVQQVVRRLEGGETAALISDAGTPGISDPGFLLVRECVKQGIGVRETGHRGANPSRCHRIRSSPREQRTPLRQILLRRIPATEEGTADTVGNTQRRAPQHCLLRVTPTVGQDTPAVL